jgi:triacylglycerol lipase
VSFAFWLFWFLGYSLAIVINRLKYLGVIVSRFKGLVKLLELSVDRGVTAVEGVHRSLSKTHFGIASTVHGAQDVSQLVHQLERMGSSGIYSAVRLVNRGVGVLAQTAVTVLEASHEKKTAESDLKEGESVDYNASDLHPLLPILNGVVGDLLQVRDNELAISMEFIYENRTLSLSKDELSKVFPRHKPLKLCLLLHGLVADEKIWRFPEDPHHSYGTLLEKEMGYTPVYVRYNSGLHISHNAKAFSKMLEQFVSNLNRPVEEIVLIGHSMGGLVLRAAGWYGAKKDHKWIHKTSKMIYIASPHHGAPMEKIGHLLCRVFKEIPLPYIQLAAQIGELRSAGIKDLRFGYLTDQEWQLQDPGALLRSNKAAIPLLLGVEHYAASGSLTSNPDNPVSLILGDAIVRASSAKGISSSENISIPFCQICEFPGIGHLKIAHHPKVYEQIKVWLGN